MTLMETIQVIQDYYPERVQFGVLPTECLDLADILSVSPRRVAFAINQLACEFAAIEDEVSRGY